MSRPIASAITFDDDDMRLIRDSLYVSIDDLQNKLEETEHYDDEDRAAMRTKVHKLSSLIDSINYAETAVKGAA